MTNLVARFERNTKGRDLIVGDIHGYFTRLQEKLTAIGFDPERDRLFSVGDLVDRGPESDQALEWLSRPWFAAVSGNHEEMAIVWPTGSMEDWRYIVNGGGWNVGNPPAMCAEISQAFQGLPVAIELETSQGLVGIVHAECPAARWPDFIHALTSDEWGPNEREHVIAMARWLRSRSESLDDTPVEGVRAVVVGHTPMPEPITLGNTIYIDTKGWKGGYFTILDAETLQPV